MGMPKSTSTIAAGKKGFALSTWNIYADLKNIPTVAKLIELPKDPKYCSNYFVLNTPTIEIFMPAYKDMSFYKLATDASGYRNKKIIMLDEHLWNENIAYSFEDMHLSSFDYEVWEVDHGFTTKRASLINKVISFLED
jgi:hypothetical protein